MAPSKIRKAIGAVKDQTSISIAKVSKSTSTSDLDVAIVKATRHDEYPAEEKHIREILSLTCYSRSYIGQCVSTLSRRLSKTRSWTVALKTLILIHRLLSEGDPTYEQEIFFATRRGTRMLNLSDFRDSSRSDAWDFSAFVRTYARYLDGMLEYRMQGRRERRRSRSLQLQEEMMGGMDEEEKDREKALVVVQSSTPVREMRTEKIFSRTQHLQQLLEHFLACRPTGSAKHNRIVAVALHPVLKESYQLYYDLQEVMAVFADRFMDLDVPSCVRIFDILTRLSKQFDDLDRFYCWCKSAGISPRSPSEFPDVERITQQKLDAMDHLIRDKSNLAKNKKPVKSFKQLTSEEDARRAAEEAAAAVAAAQLKALPAPEPAPLKEEHDQEEEEVQKEKEPPATKKVDEDADLLNFGDDSVMVDDHADKFALALFDGNPATTAPALTWTWEAFADEADWETALVQSASNLSGERATLGGGFDMLLLDGMYSQPLHVTTQGLAEGSGSASSIALPKATPMLALPAPPTTGIGGAAANGGSDPFSASLSVPAPSYVQMTDMGKKQQLLMEEQVMWQNYARDGMQGQATIAKLQAHAAAAAGMNLLGDGGYVQRF